MTLKEFIKSAEKDEKPPEHLTEALKALWWDRKGDWERAHKVAQEVPGYDGSWVHAYLHRREEDLGNARYWYNRAGQPEPEGSLAEEWTQIAETLLAAVPGGQ